jgi:glucose-6-phosphate isomerase
MASISGAAAPPSSSACRLRLRRHLLLRPSHLRLRAPHSIADLSRSSSSSPAPLEAKPAQDQNGAHGRGSVEKDPINLWNRYLEWLYQHKELGLFVDVSRMGFTEDFLQQMEPRMQRAFTAMRDLEKGAIANPDESRMVGHYWLRNPELAPNSFLRSKIENALVRILAFSHDVVSGKVAAKFSICFVINQNLLLLWSKFRNILGLYRCSTIFQLMSLAKVIFGVIHNWRECLVCHRRGAYFT